jgi:hypothetical protein
MNISALTHWYKTLIGCEPDPPAMEESVAAPQPEAKILSFEPKDIFQSPEDLTYLVSLEYLTAFEKMRTVLRDMFEGAALPPSTFAARFAVRIALDTANKAALSVSKKHMEAVWNQKHTS